ncbi:MAG: DNA-directed RNA polymerase subunit omega [Candidatus Omnitrophota bacterium]|nr:DNA-directed RNA polymerase subunit omega [Candidatus Omnitrophota bacterium]
MLEDKDLSYIPIEQLMNRVDSIYKLVLLASQRAVEISEGAQKLVDISPKIKASTVALEEIKEGKVSYKITGGGK